jgi:hypothetical protein
MSFDGYIVRDYTAPKIMESAPVYRITEFCTEPEKSSPRIIVGKKLNNADIRKGQPLVKKKKCWHVCTVKDLEKIGVIVGVAYTDAPKGRTSKVEVVTRA